MWKRNVSMLAAFLFGEFMKPYKIIDKNDDELVVEGYIAIWGDEQHKDTDGEYFVPSTNFNSSYTQTNTVIVDWEHGLMPERDENGKAMIQPGVDDPLGLVNMKTAKPDDVGLLVQMILDRRQWYVSEVAEPLLEAQLVGGSSQATDNGIVVEKSGAIKKWPLKRHTLTVWPADPRQLTEHQVNVIKSINTKYPTLKSYLLEVLQGDSTAKTDDGVGAGDYEQSQKTQGEINMSDETKETPVFDSEEMTKAIGNAVGEAVAPLSDLAKELKAWKEEMEKAPVKSGGVAVIGDSADRAAEGNPFKTAAEFYEEVQKAGMGQKFDERLLPLKTEVHKEGVVYTLPEVAQKALKAPSGLSEVVPADGGFLVGSQRQEGVMMRDYMNGMVWNRAMNIPIGPNSNGLTMNVLAEASRVNGSRWGGVLGYWLAEADEKTSSKPTFKQLEPKLKKVAALVYATDELLMDSTALAGVISAVVPQELAFQKDDAAINGSGVGKPLGILNAPALVTVAKEANQAATTLVAENIIKMWARRWARGSYVWFINQDVEPQLHQMNLPVGTGGALVYMPPGGLSGAPYGTLYGQPVIPIEQCATLGTVGDIILADMSQYLTISKGGVQQAESIHVRFIYDESVFRFVERVDGMPAWYSALTPFKGSNTQSPFVALATRS